MINKVYSSLAEIVADVQDGVTIMVGGFGEAGAPDNLMHALVDQGASDLTIISNNVGYYDRGLGQLIAAGRVRKVIVSFPNYEAAVAFRNLYLSGKIELELVPQGTLSERIRCAAAGLGGFYTPVGAGTELATGKETREIDGRLYVLEKPLSADFAFIRAKRADRWGNLVYWRAGRNFNPIMAMGARTTVAEVDEIVPLGALDPDQIHTPSVFVDRVIACPRFKAEFKPLRS